MDMMAAVVLIVALFAVLGAGMWIGLGLLAVGLIGMELFTSRPVGDSMMLTIWGASSAWTLTALPLFVASPIIASASPTWAWRNSELRPEVSAPSQI